MTTPFLGIEEMVDGQGQPHTVVNQAFETLETAININVVDRAVTVPPTVPVSADRYIVPSGATGAWTGQTNRIAYRSENDWKFLVPRIGWIVWVESENDYYEWDGAAWVVILLEGGIYTASEVLFDNAGTGITEQNVQDVLDLIAYEISLLP